MQKTLMTIRLRRYSTRLDSRSSAGTGGLDSTTSSAGQMSTHSKKNLKKKFKIFFQDFFKSIFEIRKMAPSAGFQ